MNKRQFLIALMTLPAPGARALGEGANPYRAGAPGPTVPPWFVHGDVSATSEAFWKDVRSRNPAPARPPLPQRDGEQVAKALAARESTATITIDQTPTSGQISAGVPYPLNLKETDVKQRDALAILSRSPTGPTPLDVLEYFATLTDVGPTGQLYRTEWKAERNPLIDFFLIEAGIKRLNSDRVSWCAACLNWCIKRATGYNSPDSSRALDFPGHVKRTTDSPERGDVVVFRDRRFPQQGHVGLFTGFTGDYIGCLGGNQTVKSGTHDPVRGISLANIHRTRDRSLEFVAFLPIATLKKQ